MSASNLTMHYLMPFVSVRVMVTNLVPDGHHQAVIAAARSLQKLLSLNALTSASVSPSVGQPSVSVANLSTSERQDGLKPPWLHVQTRCA